MLSAIWQFNPVGAMLGFIVLMICLAIVVILCRWLLSLTGWVIPQPLLVVAGLLLFLIFLAFFLSWTGIYSFGGGYGLHR
jgi:hypothetical protein